MKKDCWLYGERNGDILSRYEDGLSMKKDHWLYGVAVVAGIIVWVVVSTVSHRREAWDSQWYFLVGTPVVCVLSAVLGFVEPNSRGDGESLLLPASFPGCWSPRGRVISCRLA